MSFLRQRLYEDRIWSENGTAEVMYLYKSKVYLPEHLFTLLIGGFHCIFVIKLGRRINLLKNSYITTRFTYITPNINLIK
jgi:hypothetical protein